MSLSEEFHRFAEVLAKETGAEGRVTIELPLPIFEMLLREAHQLMPYSKDWPAEELIMSRFGIEIACRRAS